MQPPKTRSTLRTTISAPENRAKIFYTLAFIPLLAIIYFHYQMPSSIIVPFYGFLLLTIKKDKLFLHTQPNRIQQTAGLILIVISPFIHLVVLRFFPSVIYYGALNYATHILGLFLVFFNTSALKEAIGPTLLILVPSTGPILSRWAETYFTPSLPAFTSLIVAIVNAIGITAEAHNPNANWVTLQTPHGVATYQVLWACVGFESAFLFAIVLIILLFEASGTKKSKATWAVIGLAGTFILNILRIVLIFVTEYFYNTGGSAQVHYFAGYILFLTWVTAFTYLYSKRTQIPQKIMQLSPKITK